MTPPHESPLRVEAADCFYYPDVLVTCSETDRDPLVKREAVLVVEVLSNTQPTTTSAGAPSKAKYIVGDGVAERTHAASAEMLDKHPLYPGLELS